MEENIQEFRGFTEEDEANSRHQVQHKLANLNSRLASESQTLVPALELTFPRRPANRFLKPGDGSPSSKSVGQNFLSSPLKVRQGVTSPATKPTTSIKTTSATATAAAQLESPAATSSKVSESLSLVDDAKSGSDTETKLSSSSTGIPEPSTVVCENKTAPTTPPKRVNKFLKPTSSKIPGNASTPVAKVISPSLTQTHAGVSKKEPPKVNPTKILKKESQPTEPAIETATIAVVVEMAQDDVPMEDNASSFEAAVGHLDLGKVNVAVTQNNDTNRVEVEESSSENKNVQPVSALNEEPEQQQPPSAQDKVIIQPPTSTPAKVVRTSSTPELKFLTSPNPSSRSKRTIVPNKRFFSTDCEPVAAQTPNRKVSLSSDVSAPNAKSSKKRTLSGSPDVGTATTKKVRKSSTDGQLKSNGIDSNASPDLKQVQPSSTPSESDLNGRPRRTIIPNRKFVSTEESPPAKDVLLVAKKQVEVTAKKATDILETKRKRRKSEKAEPKKVEVAPKTDSSMHQAIMEMSFPSRSEEKKPDVPASVNKVGAHSFSAATTAPVESNKDIVKVEVPPAAPQINGGSNGKADPVLNGAKTEEANKDVEMLPDGEATLFQGKSIFVGTCILKITDSKNSDAGVPGIICCGICSCVKKYRFPNGNRKRGSFLCNDCVTIVSKIFQLALKAQPFSCILGPPVCEGWCPLVLTPENQFCQACFAKTCLKNLPLKDDIYFKIWRSIPPMSRGCVPTAPVVNIASPNVGKIAYVDDKGDIVSTTSSLKVLRPKKNGGFSGSDVISEDSCSTPETELTMNADEDLNSARIKVIQRTGSGSPSNNCENIPLAKESHIAECSESDSIAKSNGVTKEEMLLGRQIGQERVKTLVDSILKPDLDDISTFGFPVIVSGSSYPRKPLCFLCGSSGIEQLIYCSMCCEPYHPYCSGDDLLLDTYIARCNSKQSQLMSSERQSEKYPEEDSTTSKIVLKWTCRRCIACKTCGDTIGSKELIRCNLCQHPFHLQTCIDKQLLSKVKDLDKLRKVWTCDKCLKCKSCSKKIESNRRVHTIQQVAEAENSDEEDEDDEVSSEVATQRSGLMLCLDCFKQRKKGSFCPICEVCYDDNDWESKMMECSKCSRWIHSTCEDLNDEQYHILGKLPEYIEYVCRLCQSEEDPALWPDAIQSQLAKLCSSALRLFEKKALGSVKRKRSSVSVDSKPSFVCNLFGEKVLEGTEMDSFGVLKSEFGIVSTDEDSPRLPVKKVEKAISFKELTGCKVLVRDFIKYPATLQENLYALKILGVEILNEETFSQSMSIQNDIEVDRPRTPICTTPTKCFTPTKHVASIVDSVKNIGSIISLDQFQTSLVQEIEYTCENEDEMDVLIYHVIETMKETFPWFEQQALDGREIEPSLADSEATTEVPDESCCDFGGPTEKQLLLTTNPFKEVYWDPVNFFDYRFCVLCGEVGDFPPETCGRLLWCGTNEWIHCNCAIWSSEVWEHEDGALQQVGGALNRGKMLRCKVCNEKGATVSCCHTSCKNSYHFLCALNANCFLMEDKTMFCSHHVLKDKQRGDLQHDMKVGRKVFVDLDWIHKKGIKAFSDEVKVFIGSLKVESFGSIVPVSVTQKDWEDSSSTLLVPRDFQAHRIFWSLEHPWRKESYIFATRIDSGGFLSKVQDIGVNIVVDHGGLSTNIQRGLDGIRGFHQWLKKAPKYIDEELIDWLPSCSEVFYKEEVEVDEFEVELLKLPNKRRGSPSSSVSSYESCRKALNCNQSLNFSCRSKSSRDLEGASTEGYISSAESLSYSETPKSSKVPRAQKRRRSSYKTRKTPTRRCKTLTSSGNYESPRRRSMRNRYLENQNDSLQDAKESAKTCNESDSDSGVVEGGSSTGSCDVDKIPCRVNLLNRFNESFERAASPDMQQNNAKVAVTVPKNHLLALTTSSYLLPSAIPESSDDHSTNQIETMDTTSLQILEGSQEFPVLKARLKFQMKTNCTTEPLFETFDARSMWMHLFEKVSQIREANNFSQLICPTFNKNLIDEYMERANSFQMLGITHRSIQFIIEQLPGVVGISNQHQFRYSHRPFVDPNDVHNPVPLNGSGSARTEGFLGRKPHDMFGFLASRHRKVNLTCNIPEDSGRSQGLPLAMQFRDLGERSKKRFVVLHSEIHGRGLFARCDVEKGEMLIEYAGEVIRASLTDSRERFYESRGIGCYMFRMKTQVIDATMKGNAGRFINHSCEPNCEAKTIRILGSDHIIIFALRKIFKGEELTYDYKFEREEDKIPCSCGAARCRRYLN